MRALDLQTNMACSTSGRSLSSNYVPPCLENKLLTQASSSLPSTSLQPSGLTSTSSSFLLTSSSSISSPLLSTQNPLLNPSCLFSISPSTTNPLLATSLAGSDLLSQFSQLPSFLSREEHQKRDDEGGEDISEAQPCSFEETSMVYSDEDDQMSFEDEEDSEEEMVAPKEMHVPEQQEKEQTVACRREEYAEVVRDKQQFEEEIKDKKYLLLNAVCCSLVHKSATPGQKDWDSQESVWTKITSLVKDIAVFDPQFVLKVALYTRQELNIRITANFLLALAANHPSTKCHVRRYFCATVQLPSDWLEIVRIYSTCFSRSLPMCLKKAMADKFKQFSEYQLAKYNTRKHRCKHNRNRRASKKPSDEDLKKWGNLLRSDPTILQKYLQVDAKKTVDKKQNEFNMKKMIKKLHIKEPAEHVMAILGRKYPADQKAFTFSGLKGDWERERAGQRMKLKDAETWERLLSQEGNKAATWEKLIDNKSLPFMAMLRNLRNMIRQGISMTHHQKILSRLTNKKAVLQSRQFPFRFLSAYKVIMELRSLSLPQTSSNNEILKNILKKVPQSKRFRRLDWETAGRKRLRVALGVPFVYRIYRMKKDQLAKANLGEKVVSLLDSYRKALETAVQISCRYNIPPLPGCTIILININMDERRAWGKNLDFCLPPESEHEDEEEEEEEEEDDDRKKKKKKKKEDKLSPLMLEVTVLLSLMIANSCEDARIVLLDYSHYEEAQLKCDILLDNVRSVMQQIKALKNKSRDDQLQMSIYVHQILQKNKVENIIMLTESYIHNDLEWAIKSYRKETGNKCLYIQLAMSDRVSYNKSSDRNQVFLQGFSEQILRFVAERGSSRLLDHVEHLDKVYNVPPPAEAKDPDTTISLVSIPSSPKSRYLKIKAKK